MASPANCGVRKVRAIALEVLLPSLQDAAVVAVVAGVLVAVVGSANVHPVDLPIPWEVQEVGPDPP